MIRKRTPGKNVDAYTVYAEDIHFRGINFCLSSKTFLIFHELNQGR
jgi:hypothetical protein